MSSSKKPSLLVVSQYYYPEQFRINDMCEEWVKRGYDVTVITGIPNYPQGKYFDGYGWFKRRKEIHNGVEIIRLPIISRGTSKIRLGFNYISFVISGLIWKTFTKQQANLVFSFEVSPMTQVLPAVWFAKRRNIPCIAYIQDLWPENFIELTGIKCGPIIYMISKMTDYIYNACSRILVTSNSFKKVIENRGIDAEKVHYWPQYAEDFYKPSQTISPIVKKDESFTLVFTGNIGFAQGLEILPEVAKKLLMQNKKIRFLMVGDGRALPQIKEAVTQKGVETSFQFIPRQQPEDIPAILAVADAAFVSFASNALFSMTIPAKLQSYMACGVPIIAAADGETCRIVTTAACGLCCPAGDAEALTKTIGDMMALSNTSRRKMGENAVAFSTSNFNKTHLLDMLDCLFHELTLK